MNDWKFQKELRALRRVFEKHVMPELRKRRFALTKSEKKRADKRRNLKRLQKAQQRRKPRHRLFSGKGQHRWYFFEDNGKK